MLFALLYSTSVPAREHEILVWNPTSIEATLQPGQSKKYTVSITVDKNIPESNIRVSPNISSFVTVNPIFVGKLHKGTTITFTLTLSVPIDALPTTVTGGISLVRSSSNDSQVEKEPDEADQPLPVKVSVVWPKAEGLPGGTSFSYPTLGQPSRLDITQSTDGIVSVRVVFITPGFDSVPQYVIDFIPNPQKLSLTDWFSKEVDLSGAIFAGGQYKVVQLDNGIGVLDITGPIPDAHLASDGGPVSDLYALSPTGTTIVEITSGQEQAFGMLGVTPSERQQLYYSLLKTMSLP